MTISHKVQAIFGAVLWHMVDNLTKKKYNNYHIFLILAASDHARRQSNCFKIKNPSNCFTVIKFFDVANVTNSQNQSTYVVFLFMIVFSFEV